MTKLFKMILLLWLFSISSFAQDTWTVAGVSSIFGSEWAPTDTSNDMTSEDGVIFTLTKKDLSLSAGIVYEYKVVKNHSWDNESYGQDGGEPNKTFSVSQDGLYDLIITFNVNTKDLSERPIIKNWTGAEKAKAFYYVGSLNNWSTTDKSYPFTLLDDGKTWELTVTAVDNDGWFKIAPDFAYEKPSSFFDNLLCAPYDGCEELSGNMEYGNLGAWHLPQSDLFHSYTIRIIPLEMTYEIVPITIEKPNKIQIWQDPQTKVNYIYTVGESTASVKEGSSTAGSPDAIGNVAILSKFTVDGNEYTVTSIGSCAFQSCIGLTSVIIPYSVTTIGINAFSGCTGLTSITLSEGVTSIGNMAFEGCTGLTSVTIPESVTSIDSYAFSLCTGLTNITIPSSVTTTGYRAFYRCYGLTSVTIPEGITCIGPGAFEFCTGLTNVYIPESVTKIDYGAFSSCSGLSSINLPKSVVSIGNFAFLGCTGLVSINLPEGLTNIGSQAFEDCTGLTSITIPSSVTNISYIAFSGCTNLKSVYCYAENVPTTSDNAFSNSSYKEATLYVPSVSINTYKSTVPWSEFGSIKEIGNEEPTPPFKYAVQTMILHHAGGNVTEVGVDRQTSLQFKDDKVIVLFSDGTKEFSKDNVLSITYTYLRTDVNGDGTVDVADISTIINVMAGNSSIQASLEADANGDGMVDVADISTVISTMAELARRANLSRQADAEAANGTVGEAFYIYRNDGQFNAFFREEIDSIGFSHYDADSLRYNKIASQVVYTSDSTYYIPLAAIDSVGFVQPETIVNSDVFLLTAEHSPYIFDADTLRFTMTANTPQALMPRRGNIVVATADCEAFPDGIVARVESMTASADGTLYQCTMSNIEEVFDQLVIYTKGVEQGGGVDEARGFDLRRATLTHVLWDKEWSKTIEGGGTKTTITAGDRAVVTVTAKKTLTTPFFFQLEMQNTMRAGIDFTATSSVGHFEQRQIGTTISAGKITVPYTMGLLWLTPKLSLYGYFQEEGKVELKYAGHLSRTDKVTFTYTKGKWSFNHAPVNDAGTDVAQLSMEGYAEVGLRPQVDFSLNGRRAGFGFSASVGLKEYINFIFDATKLSDGGLYDAMRDSYCRTTIPWSLTAHASADIFGKYDSDFADTGFATFSYTFTPKTEPQWGEDRYIFPLFGGVEGKRQGEKATAKASVSRTTLLPVQVGFSLIDKDKKIVQTKYDGRSYRAGNTFSNYSCELSGLEGSEKYTVRPSVKLFGYDVLASPEVEVKDGKTSCPDENHPHWIDLGIGTQWRCCNEGASRPEEYGGYYTFGQVASAPTLEQIKALVNNCSYTWTTQNGVNGGKFTGPNGGTIFLPAAGHVWDGELYGVGSWGLYWRSTSGDESSAYHLLFSSGGAYWYDYWFYRSLNQLTVRPVR